MGKACRVKQRTKAGKKRIFFTGNIHTRQVMPVVESEPTVVQSEPTQNQENVVISSDTSSINYSVSARKVQSIETSTSQQTDNKICGYRLIDVDILSAILNVLCCQNCCNPGLKLLKHFQRKKDFHHLYIYIVSYL